MPRELLSWRTLSADATLQGENGQVAASAVLNERGQLDGRVAIAGLTSASPQIDGHVTASLPGLGVVEAFVPQLMNVQGSLALDARLAGALDAPRIDGEARLEQLGFDLPMLNIKPRDGRVAARLTGDGPIQIDGSLKIRRGQLEFKGQAQLDGTAQVNVSGKNVLAADIPRREGAADARSGREAHRHAHGPHRQAADPVGRHRPAAPTQRQTHALDVARCRRRRRSRGGRRAGAVVTANASVDVSFGDAVKLKGYGLDATVGGELAIRERPGEVTTASGELHVSGAYQAYGQDLKIQQGQLLYAGTPVDNPRLAIIAVREIDTVKAGFRVGGSARNPELTVSPTPRWARPTRWRTSSPASRSIRSAPARAKVTRCSQRPASSAPPPAAGNT